MPIVPPVLIVPPVVIVVVLPAVPAIPPVALVPPEPGAPAVLSLPPTASNPPAPPLPPLAGLVAPPAVFGAPAEGSSEPPEPGAPPAPKPPLPPVKVAPAMPPLPTVPPRPPTPLTPAVPPEGDVALRQNPLAQLPEAQSMSLKQALPTAHFGQTSPPQSIAVSLPSSARFSHSGGAVSPTSYGRGEHLLTPMATTVHAARLAKLRRNSLFTITYFTTHFRPNAYKPLLEDEGVLPFAATRSPPPTLVPRDETGSFGTSHVALVSMARRGNPSLP